MTYTFAALISALAAARAFPADLDAAGQKAVTNEALERIINSGRFNGTEGRLAVTVNSSGEMTLPRGWKTVTGVKVNGWVRNLASPWYDFLPGTDELSQWSTNVVDEGTGFPTFSLPTALVTDAGGVQSVQRVPAKLRITCAGASGTVEVHGQDVDGAEVYTGTQRGTVLTFNAAKAAPYFYNITAVIKPVTTAVAYLYACYDDSTEEIIGVYQPGETVPNYRRYLVGEAANRDPNDLEAVAVEIKARREHIDLVADNDVCPISNFGGLKNAVLSVTYENEGEGTRSDGHFNKALKLLNDELKLLRPPSEIGAIRVNAQACMATNLYSMR